jgi:hypothetical protein
MTRVMMNGLKLERMIKGNIWDVMIKGNTWANCGVAQREYL